MKSKITLALLFASSLVVSISAQNFTQTIRGVVIDKITRISIPGATIVLADSALKKGTVSDLDGKFRIENVPVGRRTLQVSLIGYNSVTLANMSVTSGKEVVLNIELQEKVDELKEVVVTGAKKQNVKNEMATVSARSFSVEETQRYAGSRGDVSRMAQNFAGVQGADDSRNHIIIRGNSPTGLLFRLEGIDIPNPNHFGTLGTTGGPVSILNNNVLANSDFMTGAFPAEYGNALSGVFDLKMRNGNNEKHEFLAQMGFNGAELMAEGPLSKKSGSSYLIAYRYSTLKLFQTLGVDIGTKATPKFQDLSFKFNFPHKSGTTSIIGIGGTSHVDLLARDVDTTSGNLYGIPNVNSYYRSNIGTVGIAHTQILNDKTYLKISLSSSVFDISYREDSLVVPSQVPFQRYSNDFRQIKESANLFVSTRLNVHHNIKAGFYVDQLQFNLPERKYISTLSETVYLTNYKGAVLFAQPYIQWQYRISDQLTLNTGVHYMHYFYNNNNSIEPRAGIKWQVNPNQSFGLAYGLHSQMVPVQITFKEVKNPDGTMSAPNKNIGFSKSQHFVFGYDQLLTEHMRLKTEVYYQQLSNVPVDIHSNAYSLINFGADYVGNFPDTLQNSGTGKNYGVELTLERFLNNGFYFLITGSVFESKYKGSDGIERNTAFNGNYGFNALTGRKFNWGKRATSKKRPIA